MSLLDALFSGVVSIIVSLLSEVLITAYLPSVVCRYRIQDKTRDINHSVDRSKRVLQTYADDVVHNEM